MLTSFIFPAFSTEYSGNETEILRSYSSDFEILLNEASSHLEIDLKSFDIYNNSFHDDELNTQFISYIFGCAVSDLFRNKKIKPDYISGYSMGLYAALYRGGSVTFHEGLNMIRKAFDLVKQTTLNLETGMGSIVGLTSEDIQNLVQNYEEVTIINTNGIYSHQISGNREEIKQVLNLAKAEGALHTSLMNVTCPYHTSLLNKASASFIDFLSKENFIKDSAINFVSGIDQRVFSTKDEIILELTNNLNTKINWLKTMEKLLSLGVSSFMECGAGASLYKIGKFIKGEFVIYPVNKLDKIFDND